MRPTDARVVDDGRCALFWPAVSLAALPRVVTSIPLRRNSRASNSSPFGAPPVVDFSNDDIPSPFKAPPSKLPLLTGVSAPVPHGVGGVSVESANVVGE
jgi:hypothetical protein